MHKTIIFISLRLTLLNNKSACPLKRNNVGSNKTKHKYNANCQSLIGIGNTIGTANRIKQTKSSNAPLMESSVSPV